MARSTNVYTVFYPAEVLGESLGRGVLMGAFTVKHELVRAVAHHIGLFKGKRPTILRSPDGRMAAPVDISDQFDWGPP